MVERLDADLLAVQEAFPFQLRWLARHVPGYEIVGDGRDKRRRGEHTAVLARRSVAEVTDHRTRWFGDAPERPGTRLAGARFPRIATTVVLRLGPGTTLRFTSTHLDEHSADRRDASAAQLIEWIGETPDIPHVLAGDFNATPDAAMFDAFAMVGLRSVLPAGAGGTSHRFSGRHDGRQIDHILVTEGIEVISADILHSEPGARLPSDHWPVAAELRFLPNPSAEPGKSAGFC